eukprot:scaffold758_cov387-Pavlova_lutheri.AAC.9
MWRRTHWRSTSTGTRSCAEGTLPASNNYWQVVSQNTQRSEERERTSLSKLELARDPKAPYIRCRVILIGNCAGSRMHGMHMRPGITLCGAWAPTSFSLDEPAALVVASAC